MEYSRIPHRVPPLIRWFSKTSYFRYLAIHHWVHHRYENCNYNLLLGGDIILGVCRSPSDADLAVIGLWTPQLGFQTRLQQKGQHEAE